MVKVFNDAGASVKKAGGVDVAAHEQKRDEFQKRLMRVACKDLSKTVVQTLGNKSPAVNAFISKVEACKFDVFPSERQKVVGTIMDFFHKQFQHETDAILIQSSVLKHVENQMQLELQKATEATTTSALVAAKQQEPKRMPVYKHIKEVQDMEDAEIGVNVLLVRRLASAIGKHLVEHGMVAKTPTSAENACNLSVETPVDGTKPYIVRHGAGMCRMPFWGNVVAEQSAALAPRSLCLPLFENEDDLVDGAPKLFLDGSSMSNLARSDVCIPWLVPRAPKPLEPKESSITKPRGFCHGRPPFLAGSIKELGPSSTRFCFGRGWEG